MSTGTRHLTAEAIERLWPGLLGELDVRGVEISNNAGSIIVNGYLGDVLGALADAARTDTR